MWHVSYRPKLIPLPWGHEEPPAPEAGGPLRPAIADTIRAAGLDRDCPLEGFPVRPRPDPAADRC